MRNKANNRSRFGIGLLIYVIVFLILLVVALLFFYDFLEQYEASRPYNAVDAFEAEVSANGPTDACIAAFSAADRNLLSEEEIRSYAAAVLSAASYTKSSVKSTEERLAYNVRSGGNVIGTVYFTQAEKGKFGFAPWQKDSEEYDFSAYYTSASYTVPDDYSVAVHGTVLDDSYITKKDIRYKALSDYYKAYPQLPHLVTYTVSGYLGQQDAVITDVKGKAVTEADLAESVCLDRCTAQEKEMLTALADKFITNYVQFTADVRGTHYIFYNELRQMIVLDSELSSRLTTSLSSFGFTTTKECNITSLKYNLFCPLDASHWLIDCSYTTEIRSATDTDSGSRSVRLVAVQDEKGNLLIESMSNY